MAAIMGDGVRYEPESNTKNSSEHVEDKQPVTIPMYPSPEAERRVVRKLDRTVLLWITILYLMSYLDRSNIGNARKIGLEEDIGLSSEQYQIASAAFYIGTATCGPIGGLMLKVVRPSYWLGICAISWGGVSALQAACTTPGGLIAVRLFLGICEASFAPGCALYLSFWYLKSELSLRIAVYAGMSAVSGIASGLISYGLGAAQDNLIIQAWQALFIIEGLPTFALGLLTLWVLPGRPESGRHHWFTEEEHEIILNRRNRFTKNQDTGISWAQVKGGLLDPRLYLFILIYSGPCFSLSVSSVFLPTIVGTLGYTSIQANLFTVPIYAAAYIVLLLVAAISDRTKMRGLPIMIGCTVSGVGYILLGVVKNTTARYVFCFLSVVGCYVSFPIVLAWIASTFAGDTKAGLGIGIVIAVTHAIGVAASNVYPTKDEPQYVMGNAVAGSLTFLAVLAALAMSTILHLENRRRDRRYGRPEVGVPIDMGGDADKSPDYRYEI